LSKYVNLLELEMDYSVQIPEIGLYDVCQFTISLELLALVWVLARF